MAEDDPFIDGPGDMAATVASGQSDQAARGVRPDARPVQKRQEEQTGFVDGGLSDPRIDLRVRIGAGFLRRLGSAAKELREEPLEVGRRGGASLEHQIVARHAVARRHEDIVDDRRRRHILIDAPGAKRHAELMLIEQRGGEGAGIDVEQATGHRRAGRQAGELGGGSSSLGHTRR